MYHNIIKTINSFIKLTLVNSKMILLFAVSAIFAMALQKYIVIKYSANGLLDYFQLINVISILITLITVGSENGVLRFFYEKNKKESEFVSYFFIFSLLISALVSLFIYLDPFEWFNRKIINELCFFSLSIPFYQACRHLLISIGRGWVLALFGITNTSLFLFSLVFLPQPDLLKTYIYTNIICIYSFALFFNKDLNQWISYSFLSFTKKINIFLKLYFKKILIFSWISFSSSIMLNISQIFIRQILIAYLGENMSAELEVYQKICISLTSIQSVFLSLKIFPELLQKNSDPDKFKKVQFYNYRKTIFLFSLFNFIVIVVMGPIIFYITFGSVYKFSLLLLLIVGFSEALRFFGVMISSWQMAIGRPLIALFAEIILYALPCLIFWIVTHNQIAFKSMIPFTLIYLITNLIFSYYLYFNFKKLHEK